MQTAAFKAPEVDIGRSSKLVSAVLGRAVDLTHLASLQTLTTGIRDVWFGYALAPATGAANPVNVLVFGGTQSVEEWLEGLAIAQIDVPLVWFSGGRFQSAKASVGFLLVYAFLYEQVLAAAKPCNSAYPVYVTGHRLGHSLAVFAALPADLQAYSGGGLWGQVQMYSFAGPRVGDSAFSGAYDFLLPASFRVST